MDLEESWHKALQNTEILRTRLHALMTGADTHIPYVFLSESSINVGDSVVRKGEVVVHKPSLIVPPYHPSFLGFDFGEKDGLDENSVINFLIVRGVSLPSLSYDNRTNSLNIFEGRLSMAVKHYEDILRRQEDISTGLLTGPEDAWQFSLLVFIASQIIKNADHDIRKLLDQYKKHGPDQQTT